MDRGQKFDAGKPQMRLVPTAMMELIAKIREYGNKKYLPNSWKYVDKAVPRYTDAMLRHLYAWLEDSDSVDEESGYPHFWHFLCNASFLAHFEVKRYDENDEAWRETIERARRDREEECDQGDEPGVDKRIEARKLRRQALEVGARADNPHKSDPADTYGKTVRVHAERQRANTRDCVQHPTKLEDPDTEEGDDR